MDELMKLPSLEAAAHRSLHLLALLGCVALCGRWGGRQRTAGGVAGCMRALGGLLSGALPDGNSDVAEQVGAAGKLTSDESPPLRCPAPCSLLLGALDSAAGRRIHKRGAAQFNLAAAVLASASKPCQARGCEVPAGSGQGGAAVGPGGTCNHRLLASLLASCRRRRLLPTACQLPAQAAATHRLPACLPSALHMHCKVGHPRHRCRSCCRCSARPGQPRWCWPWPRSPPPGSTASCLMRWRVSDAAGWRTQKAEWSSPLISSLCHVSRSSGSPSRLASQPIRPLQAP